MQDDVSHQGIGHGSHLDLLQGSPGRPWRKLGHLRHLRLADLDSLAESQAEQSLAASEAQPPEEPLLSRNSLLFICSTLFYSYVLFY